MRINFKSSAACLTLFPIWIALGCKPMPQRPIESDTKSIDNFAAGSKVNSQVCGPESPSNLAELSQWISGPNEKLRFAAAQSLAAVPPKLRGALFGDKLQGRLAVVDRSEVRRQCRLNGRQLGFANENSSAVDFCWSKEPNGPLRLWVVADAAIIRHGVLRLAAYAYVQLIEGKIVGDSGVQAAGEVMQALRTARAGLSSTFLQEVRSSAKYSGQSSRLQQLRQQDANTFDHELFVEMMDSVYCSAQSQRTFHTEFRSTFEHFVGRGGPGSINFTSIFGLPWHAR
jgi:hypothetical protein